MADVDEFAAPITTGMQLVQRDETPNDKLSLRLDEFDAVRNRGAVEASVTPWPTKRPATRSTTPPSRAGLGRWLSSPD